MKYLKDLIERLSKALRGKTAPLKASDSVRTDAPGPVEGPQGQR